MKNVLHEFKPALLFLVKFLAVYFVGNIIYGVFVENAKPRPDAITIVVTNQVVPIINFLGENCVTRENPVRPTVLIESQGDVVLSVYEGCNGINVMIVFLSFAIAYGGRYKFAFILIGLIAIHLLNLTRVLLLYYTAKFQPQYFYYFHKYIFTAVLFLFVFLLWFGWIRLNNKLHASSSAS